MKNIKIRNNLVVSSFLPHKLIDIKHKNIKKYYLRTSTEYRLISRRNFLQVWASFKVLPSCIVCLLESSPPADAHLHRPIRARTFTSSSFELYNFFKTGTPTFNDEIMCKIQFSINLDHNFSQICEKSINMRYYFWHYLLISRNLAKFWNFEMTHAAIKKV